MRFTRILAALAIAVGIVSCDDDPTPPDPNATLTIAKAPTSGDAQQGLVSRSVPTALSVQVKNANNIPVQGKTVNFTAANGATVTPTSAVTDVNGIASTSLVLGPTEGTHTVTATIAGQSTGSAVFTAKAISTFISTMNSAGEPTNTGVSAVGTATYVLNGNTVNYVVDVPNGLTGTWTGLHIHGPFAPPATTSGVVVNLCPTGVTCTIGTGGSFHVEGSFTGANVLASFGTTDVARLDSLLKIMYRSDGTAYTNLHTSVNTTGQIRGPVVIDPPAAAIRREN